MIEKIKYCLARAFSRRLLRIGGLSVMTVATAAVITLLSYSIYTVNIFDGKKTYTVRALADNMAAATSAIPLENESYNIENAEISGRSAAVEIAYTYPVYITCGNKTVTVNVSDCTVKEALSLA